MSNKDEFLDKLNGKYKAKLRKAFLLGHNLGLREGTYMDVKISSDKQLEKIFNDWLKEVEK